jgi:hypothetical protein
MFVAATAPKGYCPKSVDTFRITILKARFGETDPLLFKLPQLLSQFFRRLVSEPCPSSYALAFCRFSVIS